MFGIFVMWICISAIVSIALVVVGAVISHFRPVKGGK